MARKLSELAALSDAKPKTAEWSVFSDPATFNRALTMVERLVGSMVEARKENLARMNPPIPASYTTLPATTGATAPAAGATATVPEAPKGPVLAVDEEAVNQMCDDLVKAVDKMDDQAKNATLTQIKMAYDVMPDQRDRIRSAVRDALRAWVSRIVKVMP